MNKPNPFSSASGLVPMFASANLGATNPPSQRLLLAQGTGGSGQSDETVTVHRRRRSEPPGPEGRERAEAPQRRRSDGQGGPPPSGGSGGSGGGGLRRPLPGGGQIPGGGCGLLVVLALLVLGALFGLPNLLSQNPSTPQDVAVDQSAPAETPEDTGASLPAPTPTRAARPVKPAKLTARPTAASPASGSSAAATPGQTWTVMLYQDADDKILEKDIYVDLNEAERVGSSDRVNIVAQVDRFRAGYTGDGDWTGAKRFYVEHDENLQQVRSQQVADLGEVNMSDGKTLVDFVTWAAEELSGRQICADPVRPRHGLAGRVE